MQLNAKQYRHPKQHNTITHHQHHARSLHNHLHTSTYIHSTNKHTLHAIHNYNHFAYICYTNATDHPHHIISCIYLYPLAIGRKHVNMYTTPIINIRSHHTIALITQRPLQLNNNHSTNKKTLHGIHNNNHEVNLYSM